MPTISALPLLHAIFILLKTIQQNLNTSNRDKREIPILATQIWWVFMHKLYRFVPKRDSNA